MTTISVDIREQDLVNFTSANEFNLARANEQGLENIFKQHPFTLYKVRMSGNHMVTIQIPLVDYFLFLSSGLVK